MFESFFKTLSLLSSQLYYSDQHRLGFQPPASINFERIIDLHHFVFFYLIVVLIIVLWVLISLIDNFSSFSAINNNFTINSKNNILSFYTTKFFSKLKLTNNQLINIIETTNEKVNNIKLVSDSGILTDAKQIIGLNEHLNLYIRSAISFLIAEKVYQIANS